MTAKSAGSIRVKISMAGTGPNAVLDQFIDSTRSLPADADFYFNDVFCKEADVWIVVERPDGLDTSCRVSPDRVVFVGAETSYSPAYWERYRHRRRYLDQFAEVHTWLPLRRSNVVRSLPYLPWMINANHGDSIYAPHSRDAAFLAREIPPKSAGLSVICSDKAFTKGHAERLQFVRRLYEEFGDSITWFGNGVNSLPEKWGGIAPYRYSVVIENQSMPDLITEKLYDAYLGVAMPLYFGAPNVSDYFPADSFVPIDISRPELSIETLRYVAASDLWLERREAVLQSRDLVLTRYNLVYRFAELALRLIDLPASPSQIVQLHDLSPDPAWVALSATMRHRVRKFLEG